MWPVIVVLGEPPWRPDRCENATAVLTDAAMETFGAGGNVPGGMRDQGQTPHTGRALLVQVAGGPLSGV